MVASKEVSWRDRFLEELGSDQGVCFLYRNCQIAIHLAKSLAFHTKTKHIEVIYHFIYTLLEEGHLKRGKVTRSQNPISMLIKVVNKKNLRFY